MFALFVSGHGGTSLLDGLNPTTTLSTPAPLVTSNVHVANNVNGEWLP